MSVPPFAIPPPPSYIDGEGRPHYITEDGLPPNFGVPPPPDFQSRPLSFLSLPGLAIHPHLVNVAPPSPSYTEDGRVYFITSQGIATEPTATSGLIIQPLLTSTFRPTPPPQSDSAVKYIHINFIRDNIRPHRDRYTSRDRDSDMPYTLTKVATYMRMKDLILLMGHGALDGITECKKLSDDRSWSEVQTFKISDDGSDKSLEELGWTESRGAVENPIWVCVFLPELEKQEERTYWEQLGFPAS